MALFQGLFFLLLAAGLLLIVYQSLTRGWLPCGPNGFRGRLEFRRDAQPVMYWLMFVLYAAAGLALMTFALRVLAGSAAPLPLQ